MVIDVKHMYRDKDKKMTCIRYIHMITSSLRYNIKNKILYIDNIIVDFYETIHV